MCVLASRAKVRHESQSNKACGRLARQLTASSCLALLAVAVLPPPALAQAPGPVPVFSPETVVATIDAEPLTLADLLLRYASLPQPQRDGYAARRGGLRPGVLRSGRSRSRFPRRSRARR